MPESKKQVGLAYAVLAGKSNKLSKKTAREFIQVYENMSPAERAKLPEKKKKKR